MRLTGDQKNLKKIDFFSIFSSCGYCRREYLILWSPFAIFEPWIWRRLGPFPAGCSFVQHQQLELRTSKTYSKRQNLVQNKNIDVLNVENIGFPLSCFSLRFFSALCDFWSILDSTKLSPLRLFRYFATQWMSKIPKGPLLHFSALWHCSKISLKKFLPEIFKNLPTVPLTILSLRYSADFGRSRLVVLGTFKNDTMKDAKGRTKIYVNLLALFEFIEQNTLATGVTP